MRVNYTHFYLLLIMLYKNLHAVIQYKRATQVKPDSFTYAWLILFPIGQSACNNRCIAIGQLLL